MAVERLPLREERAFVPDLAEIEAVLRGDEIVFLGRPNNPTGHFLPADALRELAGRHPATVFVIDEAFADFVAEESLLARGRPAKPHRPQVAHQVLRDPGPPPGRRRRRPGDHPAAPRHRAPLVGEHPRPGRRRGGAPRCRLRGRDAPLRPRPAGGALRRARSDPGAHRLSGDGELPPDPDRPERHLAPPNSPAASSPTGSPSASATTSPASTGGSSASPSGRRRRTTASAAPSGRSWACAGKTAARRTPVIMFQGTGSNAGKSILAAALCRILLQDGLRVAPFKAQNMSLNSYVTRDGGEMGRAQVVQAQACRIDPDVRMNPVLLKPNSDTGSQVIVLGKPIGNMDFWEYTRDRTPPFAAAKEAFDSLAAEYDAIVMEGAGSPGEVNLKKRDIVNMNMALYAGAPVLIVGDIDRGGVYASFIGTMEVLSERERALGEGVRRQPLPRAGGVPRGGPRLRPSPHGAPGPRRRPVPPGPRPPRGGLGQLQGRSDRRPHPRGRARGDRRHRPCPYLELHRFRPPPDRAGRPAAGRPAPGGAGRRRTP